MTSRSNATAGPVIVLTMILLIPAALWWGVWQWADGRHAAGEDAVPEQPETPIVAPTPEPALSTGLLSFRRSAGELSRRLNLASFESAMQPLLLSLIHISEPTRRRLESRIAA